VDAARSAARAGARGDGAAAVEGLARDAAPGAVVSVRTSGAQLTVDVTRRVRLVGLRGAQVSVRGRSTAALEQTQAGAASVLVLAVLVVALVLAAGVGGLAGVVLARHRASAAADLAALAGADVLAGRAPGDACAAAAGVAAANGARLESCATADLDLLVTARVVPPGALAALGSATGRARAGPGPSGGSG
ncbi:MAG: Rv3654c family TadE-like protein, partial [Actinomycetota bacterium]